MIIVYDCHIFIAQTTGLQEFTIIYFLQNLQMGPLSLSVFPAKPFHSSLILQSRLIDPFRRSGENEEMITKVHQQVFAISNNTSL